MPETLKEAQERRALNERLEGKLDALMEKLHFHMSDEEEQIHDIRRDIVKYFGELDAHVHTFHHNYIGEEITDNEMKNKWWSDVKKNIVTGVLMIILGATLSFIGMAMWEHTISKIPPKPVQDSSLQVKPNGKTNS